MTPALRLAAAPLLLLASEALAVGPHSSRYPGSWDIEVPAGSRLAELKARYANRNDLLPPRDLEDRIPLPLWFRAYVRERLPDLPSAGSYQYPHGAVHLLRWMQTYPDLRSPGRRAVRGPAVRVVAAGPNIDLTETSGLGGINSESAIARNSVQSQYLIAAANSIPPGPQTQFYSADGGTTWNGLKLTTPAGTELQTDPAVAFTSDQTAWAVTLGMSAGRIVQGVQIYKSITQGSSWSLVKTFDGRYYDKPALAVHKDQLYLVWSEIRGPGAPEEGEGGVRFARATPVATTPGEWTWSAVQSLSAIATWGVDVATGPLGEIYVAWPEWPAPLEECPTQPGEIRIRKSTDGGLVFEPYRVIAKTNSRGYRVEIPAMDLLRAGIYLSLGVRRDSGAVYATWTDRETPGCGSGRTNVYISASADGATWPTAPTLIPNPAGSDQFNQRLDVDPADGTLHLVYYDTRHDTARKRTHLYHIASRDHGVSWVDELPVTTADSDETDDAADNYQYGDYNGLVARAGTVQATWTDRRETAPGVRSPEKIYTSAITETWLLLPACAVSPDLCKLPAHMFPGGLVLHCLRRPCVIVDPLPKNCLVKFQCPGCRRDGVCPQYHHIVLEGLGHDWAAELVGPKGRKVDYRKSGTADRLVLTFKPDKELYREGSIGSYALTFELRQEGKPGARYTIKTQLLTSDTPEIPGR